MEHIPYDLVGVGAGPFNLSIAALLHPLPNVRHRFFERQQEYSWHPGMLLPNTTIQNSFLKDLVSFADPTNPFSFLAFLHAKKRLYEYVNAGFPRSPARATRQSDAARFSDDSGNISFAIHRLRTIDVRYCRVAFLGRAANSPQPYVRRARSNRRAARDGLAE